MEEKKITIGALDWHDESGRGGAAWRADCGRYVVRIVQDYHPDSPWDDIEGLAPFIRADNSRYGRGAPQESTHFPDVREIVAGITRDTLRPFIACLAAAVKMSGDGYNRDIEAPTGLYRECLNREGYGTGDYCALAIQAFEIAAEAFPSSNPLPVYAAAFKATGVPFYEETSTGYSQGDYAELLFCHPPQWRERYGVPLGAYARHESDMESAAKLWGFWAWGDCWGLEIETPEGEHVDSCWGFFTDSPTTDAGAEESGMADYFADMLPDDWHVDSDIGAAALYAA